MRIALAQINPILGDFQYNTEKILEFVSRAREKRADLVIFPEASLLGYHPFDLLERPEFFNSQQKALAQLQAKLPPGIGVILGLLTANKNKLGRPFYNSAALLEKGKKPKFFHKELLPTGDVFDEARFIEQGRVADNFFKFRNKSFFLSICEDIWGWPDVDGKSQYRLNPLAKLPQKKVDLVINLSASPYFPNKHETRKSLVAKTAKKIRAPMIYCNLVGAQDEIVFDGRSFLMNPKGQELLRAQAFEEDLVQFDLESLPVKAVPQEKLLREEDVRQALVLGIRDYCKKVGMDRVHLGLSGGIDSALVLCLAVDALGPGRVRAVYMPTQFNSPESQNASKKLAKNVGVDFVEVSIETLFQTAKSAVDKAFGISDFGLVHENIQARLRGVVLMAESNHQNSLLLACGNKSELAAGYSTLYGDLCGGLLPIGDLTKTQVYSLAKHYNRDRELIPKFILERPPSAELRPNQKDQDSLPEYAELDQAVINLVENNRSPKSEAEHWLLKALYKSEFKRWQSAPILKVSKHSFGRGRRWPVAHRLSKA